MKRSRKIVRQLGRHLMLTIAAAVSVITGVVIFRDIDHLQQQWAREGEIAKAVYAPQLSGPTAAGDLDRITQALAELPASELIADIQLLDPDKSLIAEETPAPRPFGEPVFEFTERLAEHALGDHSLMAIRASVVHNGERVGQLVIFPNNAAFFHHIALVVESAVGGALFAAGVGLLLILRFQGLIERPMRALEKSMQAVAQTGDFSRRVRVRGADEFAQLSIAFNNMVDGVQKREAEQLARYENLKRIVRQRTNQLKMTKEAAEAANHAKSDFLATMSHEIRTPMNGILVMAELLTKAQLPPRQQRFAEVIAKSGRGLLAIINDILDLSKIEAGCLELEELPVHPVTIINDVVGLFWERALSANIDLAAYVAPDVPETIESDPVRLNQVLSNLVNNALKFTKEGSVLVTAKMVNDDNGISYVEFAVTDTGVGIAADKQGQIFEAFSQADQTTTRKFGGSGLGLAICSRIVQHMDGHINVASREGKGSRFYFAVPAKVLEAAPPAPVTQSDLRAIIALNGEASSKSLARYLHETGVSAQIIDNDAALAATSSYADILFASSDFLENFAAEMGRAQTPWVPARICISELGDTKPDALLEAGAADDLLLKPLSRLDVMAQIQRILDGTLRKKAALGRPDDTVNTVPSFKGRRILAADDSIVNREVVSAALERFDVKPVLASDGVEAVEAVARERFDFIFMDCSMPRMDGFEATKKIREYEQANGLPHTPIIALTAFVIDIEEEWRSAGMDGFVAKPFTIDSLATAISEHIAPSKRDAASPIPAQTPSVESTPAPMQAETLGYECFSAKTLEDLASIKGEGGGDLVVRALTLFQKHSKPVVVQLTDAVRSGEAKEIKRAAHALKSMSLNVGASELAKSCAAIENGDPSASDYAAMLMVMTRNYARVCQELPQVMSDYRDAA